MKWLFFAFISLAVSYALLTDAPDGSPTVPIIGVPPITDDALETPKLRQKLDSLWPLREGLVRRYRIQSREWGPGVVEEQVVEYLTVGSLECWRIRALHRYDSGRTFIEEEYLHQDAPLLRTVARLTTAGYFGRYDPPLVTLSVPQAGTTTWSGRSVLVEEDRGGVAHGPISLRWEGRLTAGKSVSTVAGRWEDALQVEFVVDERWKTTVWLVRGLGVVRREIYDGEELVVLQELVGSEGFDDS